MEIIKVIEHPEREERGDDFPSLAEKLKEIEKLAEQKEAEKAAKNLIDETSGEYWWQRD
jgi:ABC-type Fe3+-hydroxamate transport system substrate-binding protein